MQMPKVNNIQMKKAVYIFIVGILTFLFSCNQIDEGRKTNNENKALSQNPNGITTNKKTVTELEANCNYNKILSDPNTPKLAIKLFHNDGVYSEEPLTYFDKLNSNDIKTREFYFRVITNSYTIADGAYAEGLGEAGFSFVQNNTKQFVEFFDNKDCFGEKDLEIWVRIVMMEVALVSYNEFDDGLIDDYINVLNLKCHDCSTNQQTTLKTFISLLKEQWFVLLTNMD